MEFIISKDTGALVKVKGRPPKGGIVVIPYGVTEICGWVFKEKHSIKKVIIPDTVKKIQPYAFVNCDRLEEVDLGKGVEVLEDCAFAGCVLKSIDIPSSVYKIGDRCFEGCISLETVKIRGDIEEVGKEAFSATQFLLNARHSSTNAVTYIGNYIITVSSEMTGICRIKEGVREIPKYDFQECKFNAVIIPNGVKEIPDFAFYRSKNLETVVIPPSVTYIGKFAFCLCEKLTINGGENIKNIGEGAFSGALAKGEDKKYYKVCNIGWYTKEYHCKNTVYKIGEPSKHIENVILGSQGYHFCDNVCSLFSHYSGGIDTSIAIFECEPQGKILYNKCLGTYVAQSIILTRRIYRKELIEILNEEIEG